MHAAATSPSSWPGGVGARVGLDIPKQLIKIAGHTILEHTLARPRRAPGRRRDRRDDGAGPPRRRARDRPRRRLHQGPAHPRGRRHPQRHHQPGARRRRRRRHQGALPRRGAAAGQRRGSSPSASPRSSTYDAVDVAIPSADTIIEVDEDNVIRDIPPRANLRRGQTPQAFRAGTIRAAYADRRTRTPTSRPPTTARVVLRYLPDVPIWVVAGDERNMKVTEPIDVYLADKLFQLSSDDLPRRPLSEDAYREALDGKTMVVFGGSYGIGADIADARRASTAPTVFTFSRSTPAPTSSGARTSARPWPTVLAATGRVDFVVNTAAVLPRGRPRRDLGGDGLRRHRDQLPGAGADRPGVLPAPAGHRRQPAQLHLELLHARPQRLQPLLLGEGRGGQPDPGARRRVVGRRRPGQLHQPRAHRHPDAHQGVRRGAGRHRCWSRPRWRGARSTCWSAARPA